MGFYKSKGEIRNIFNSIDKDGSSNIDFKEFRDLMQNYLVFLPDD